MALAFTLLAPAFSQYWEEAGLPAYTPAPTLVYTDTLHDWLLAAGQTPLYIDSEHAYMPLFRYNGLDWDTLGLFGNKVRTAVVYNDTLIVAGGFNYMQDTAIAIIAYYAEGSWHPYGTFGDQWGSGNITRLRVIDGVLYAVGIFQNADGQLCNGLAKRVGGHWEPMPGWPTIDFTGDPWLQDIIQFQGKLVVGGGFSVVGTTTRDLLQYDATAWVPVCNGCLQGGLDGVGGLAEYQGELYVGGIFYYGSGNAGQGIMRWDGEEWNPVGPLGDGIQLHDNSDAYSPDLSWMKVHDGLLYIGGSFRSVGHVPTPAGICAWDGAGFCVLEGEPFSTYYAPFDFYHDTLYGGTSTGVNDPAMRGVIRYLGELCANTTGVEEDIATALGLHVAWSSTGELTLLGLSDGPHSLRIYDAQGRMVLQRWVSSAAGRSEGILFTGQPSALYLVVVDNERTARVVPMR